MMIKQNMQQQRGAVLIMGLIILMILTVLGIAAMQNTTMEERMAGNTRDLQLAFHAAEAGLRAGERELSGAVLPVFNNTNGYYQEDPERWKNPDAWWFSIEDDDGNLELVTPNVRVADIALDGTIVAPIYYLEEISATQSQGSLEAGVAFDAGRYKVTSRGFGSTENATVILQVVFMR